MEPTLRAIEECSARRDRKRRASAMQGEQLSSPGSEATQDTEPAEPLPDEGMFDDGVRMRLKESVQAFMEAGAGRDGLRGGAPFVARTAAGAWMAAQAVKPLPFGVEWAALLYVCYILAKGAYFNEPSTLDTPSRLQHQDLPCLVRRLGQQYSCYASTPADLALMNAARKWSREAADGTLTAVSEGVAADRRVRLALNGVLLNAQRANALFKG